MTTQIERMEWQKLDHYGLSGYDADVIVSFSHGSMVSFDVIVVVLPHISMFIMSIVILCFCISLFTYFFLEIQKNTYKYHQELQENQEQENKNCYCHSSCRLFNLDDFFFRRKAVEIWAISQNQRQIFQMDSTASVLTEYSHLFCRI